MVRQSFPAWFLPKVAVTEAQLAYILIARIVGHLMDKMTSWQRALRLGEWSRQRVTFISHPTREKLLAV